MKGMSEMEEVKIVFHLLVPLPSVMGLHRILLWIGISELRKQGQEVYPMDITFSGVIIMDLLIVEVSLLLL
jgi:hypothetical protein